MNMPAMKTEPVTMLPAAAAPVVAMTPKRPPRADKYIKMARETAVRVVPPLIVLALLMLFWELACRRAGSTLPPPSREYQLGLFPMIACHWPCVTVWTAI